MPQVPGCQIVDEELAQNPSALSLSPEARRHVAQCRRCRELTAWMSQPVLAPPVHAEAVRRIADRLAASASPVRPLAAPGWIALRLWGGFGATGVSLAWALAKFSKETTGLDMISTTQTIAIMTAIGGVAGILSFLLAQQIIPASRRPFTLGSGTVLAGAALALAFLLLFPWRTVEPGMFLIGWQCSFRETIVAIPAAVILWRLIRGGLVTQPGAAGWITGALAGLMGLTAFQLRCPLQDSLHLLVWHGGPVVLFAILGMCAAEMGQRFFHRHA